MSLDKRDFLIYIVHERRNSTFQERMKDGKMKGCRPLTDHEVESVMNAFDGHYAARDKAIFALGRYTGERISAILKLKVGDIVQDGRILDHVIYQRGNRKGKTEGRSVALHPKAAAAMARWINQLAKDNILTADDYVFQSRNGANHPLSRIQYHKILKEAVMANHISGKVATHSMRKTFAGQMYEKLDHDIFKTAKAMGHSNVNSTAKYLSFKEEEIEAAIKGMS